MRFFGACSELAHSRRFGFVHSSENDIGFEPNMLVDLVLLFPLVRYNSLQWRERAFGAASAHNKLPTPSL
jgi:hypothetical protein